MYGRVFHLSSRTCGSKASANHADFHAGYRAALARKHALCSGALLEAARLVTAEKFGPLLRQVLGRASDLLDELDDVLVGLDPVRDHETFCRAAALHRQLDSIQSEVPREYRRYLVRQPGDHAIKSV